MVTEVGRFLRKLRIDEGEIILNMAEKLGVSASFLSAVENGKKRMPSSWNSRICEIYKLNLEQKEEFTNAIARTEEVIEMKLSTSDIKNKELAVSFARQFPDLDDEQTEQIKKILLGGKKKK